MRTTAFRAFGALLGGAAIFLGGVMIYEGEGFLSMQTVYGAGLLGTGIYFLNYAITGRPTILRYRRD